jgi:hypothetical protein
MGEKDASLISSKLLGKEFFPKVREAIKNNDVPGFSKICKAAGIPDKTSKILTSTFLQHIILGSSNEEKDEPWPAW